MSDVANTTEEEQEDSTELPVPSFEDEARTRLANLEYIVARLNPQALMPRASVTNPVDDPEAPPVDGWENHPWYGRVAK